MDEPGTTATTKTNGNLTIVEVPPAKVETINGPETKPARKNKTTDESPAPAKKTSQIYAALQVLATSKEPMNCQAMVEAMSAQRLWTAPAARRRTRRCTPESSERSTRTQRGPVSQG